MMKVSSEVDLATVRTLKYCIYSAPGKTNFYSDQCSNFCLPVRKEKRCIFHPQEYEMNLFYIPLLNTDTTSRAYRIGYAMGEFLPFVLLAIIFIWLMWRRYNASR